MKSVNTCVKKDNEKAERNKGRKNEDKECDGKEENVITMTEGE